MKKKFLRRDWRRYSRLGKNRKKIQKWRRAKGRHNKIRKMRAGYPVGPSIGYKKPSSESGKINGLSVIVVNSFNDVKRLDKNSLAIIGRRLGARKKMEVIKMLNEMKIKIANLKVEEKTHATK